MYLWRTLRFEESHGSRTAVTDQNSKTTHYAYDNADRLTSVTDAASNVTTYSYDTENNLTSIEDANSHTTSFSYDAYGRVTQTTFPSSRYESYTYDSNNNLTSKTDRKSQTINYVYDALNRLTSKTYPDSTQVEYTYDLVGKVTGISDPTGTYGLSYDNMGRLTGTSTAYSFLTGTFTNGYTYNAASNRTGFTAPDSSTNTYSYDTLNRLTTLANSWAGSFGFSYDALSRRTQMTRPNSITTNYTYDNLSRLLTVLHQSGGSTIDGASYTSGSIVNPFQYTGRDYDSETGLRYYRARYYDPFTGRFASEDPIKFQGGVDFYRYVSNSPVQRTDPSGLDGINWDKLHKVGRFTVGAWDKIKGFGDNVSCFAKCAWGTATTTSTGTGLARASNEQPVFTPDDLNNQTANPDAPGAPSAAAGARAFKMAACGAGLADCARCFTTVAITLGIAPH